MPALWLVETAPAAGSGCTAVGIWAEARSRLCPPLDTGMNQNYNASRKGNQPSAPTQIHASTQQ
ncbi:MAG: hypothetical protein KME47_24250 [Nodosilinea sp. WJT8-NPBG4]|nr:hypothetical protein [Nodosilinea sp. WJT8-NPBG4]